MIYMHVLIFLKDGSYILFQTGLKYWISKSKVSDFSWEIKRAEEGEIEERKKRTGSKWRKIKEVEENEEVAEVYANIDPCEIVQSVVEIFFGQATMGNNDKKAAKKAAEQIKDIVTLYKATVHK